MAWENDPQRAAWWQAFLQQQQAHMAAQMQMLHRAQPWNQPAMSRFQNPLVGADAPAAGDRITDPQAAIMGYFMQNSGGGSMSPMLEQYLMTGNPGFGES